MQASGRIHWEVALAAAIVLLMGSFDASASLTKDQQSCVNEMNKNGHKVNRTQLKENETCLKDHQKGKLALATFEECAADDRQGKVQKAEDKTVTQEAKKCLPLSVPPPFAYTDSATVNQAAVDGALWLARDIFGDPVDDASLITDAANKDTARCQGEMLKRANKIEDTVLKEINKAKKKAIKEDFVGDSAALETALSAVLSSNRQITQKAAQLVKGVEKACASLQASPETVFPGACADPDLGNVQSCVIAAARCEACLKINLFDALNLNCDLADDQTANLSCPPMVPPPDSPVLVSASVEGDAVPGASLTATADIRVLDGSTVQSISWTQSKSVPVTILNGATDTATVILPGESVFKDELIHVLSEPPIGEEDLPPNVPVPEGEFSGGLQSRFQVVGVNPFALEETALIGLMVEVTTTSGTYSDEVDLHVELPWKPAAGIRNVPIGIPVLVHGRDHVDENDDGLNDETSADTSVYDWMLTPATGSSATLSDATSQSPYFTPDVVGLYTLTVTDTTQLPGNEVVTIEVYAGTWEGVITGQDMDGRPLADDCTGCHDGSPAPDQFTPWAQTGHAEIFTNSLNTNTHYGENCFGCHTVGFDLSVANDGFDDAPDYQAFLGAGLINNPGDNWTTMLAQFPEAARLGNIQCENCHGPQNGDAHTEGEPRSSISSDVCAVCHGEPLRHARFQQWQLSGHANYEVAVDEGEDGSCSRCHTGNGFLTWLPVLTGDEPGDPRDDIFYCDDAGTGLCVGGANDGLACTDDDQCPAAWTADEVHPQTCATCHDPHSIGTTTGVDTNATVRISGNTPLLIAGFKAFGVGRGAICMTCHNSRRGLRNDTTWPLTVADDDTGRAPHGSAQTDLVMGENAYFVNVGIRGNHSLVEDSCVNCHMEQTPPPDLLSYNQGGTNHTFFASTDICSNCHGDSFTADGVQAAFDATLDGLQNLIEDAILEVITDQTLAGNVIDLDGDATITDAGDILEIEFGEFRGRQAITVTLLSGTVGPVRVTDIDVLDPGTIPATVLGQLYDFADERLPKAGWNWNLVNNDGSRGVHNPDFAFVVLDSAIDELMKLWAMP